MRRHLSTLAFLVLGLSCASLAVPVAAGSPLSAGVFLALGAIAGALGEARLARSSRLFQAMEDFQVGLTLRTGLRGVLLAGAVATWLGGGAGVFRVVAVTLAVIWASRLGFEVLRADAENRRLQPVTWRNLEVPGVVRHPPFAPWLLGMGQRGISVASYALVAGVAAEMLGAPRAVVVPLVAAVAVLVCAVFLAGAATDALRARSDTHHEETVELLAAALRGLAPELLFYYSRPEPVGYIANVWMPTLEKLKRRSLVLVRESHNADLVQTDRLPVVCVVRPGDIERVVPESVRIALYPSNVAKNNHLLRLPGIVDVFVGHGDSDKGGSATTLTRIFDEAWVSGPAARDRYRVADVGVRDDQIREIGRPQLAEIRHHVNPAAESHGGSDSSGAWDYTVLYAPTREGFFAEWQYSSVLSQGRGILTSLLGLPGVRVLFKPHPGTGTDDPLFGEEVEHLKTMVLAAGAPHEVVSGAEGLYQAFNRADLLVSDISSVITDFLASGKPYVVTNSGHGSEEQFRKAFPSAAGAYVLTGDGSEVAVHVNDARTADSWGSARRRTATYLLGDDQGELLARFDKAIDDAVAACRR